MSEARFCIPCGGSGKQLGGGMIIKDCDNCNGSGKHDAPIDEIDYLLKKDTDHYKSAKKRIKEINSNLSDEEIENMLDGELSKLNDTPLLRTPKPDDMEFKEIKIGDEVIRETPPKYEDASGVIRKMRGRPKVNKNG